MRALVTLALVLATALVAVSLGRARMESTAVPDDAGPAGQLRSPPSAEPPANPPPLESGEDVVVPRVPAPSPPGDSQPPDGVHPKPPETGTWSLAQLAGTYTSVGNGHGSSRLELAAGGTYSRTAVRGGMTSQTTGPAALTREGLVLGPPGAKVAAPYGFHSVFRPIRWGTAVVLVSPYDGTMARFVNELHRGRWFAELQHYVRDAEGIAGTPQLPKKWARRLRSKSLRGTVTKEVPSSVMETIPSYTLWYFDRGDADGVFEGMRLFLPADPRHGVEAVSVSTDRSILEVPATLRLAGGTTLVSGAFRPR